MKQQNKIMYRTGLINLIDIVEIENVTHRYFWINGQRWNRFSKTVQFFDTFDEAKTFLIKRFSNSVDFHQRQLKQSKEILATIENMTEVKK